MSMSGKNKRCIYMSDPPFVIYCQYNLTNTPVSRFGIEMRLSPTP